VNWSVAIAVTRVFLRGTYQQNDQHKGRVEAYLCFMIEQIFNDFIIARVSSTVKHGHVGGGGGDVDEIRRDKRRENWIAIDGKVMKRS
jgi:hypothetical protein